MIYDALHDFGEIDLSADDLDSAAFTIRAFPDVFNAGTPAGRIADGEQLFVEIEIDEDAPPTVTTPGTDYYVMNFALAWTDQSTAANIGTAAAAGAVEVVGRSGEYAAVGSDPTIGGQGDFAVTTMTGGLRISIPVPPLPRGVAIDASKVYLAVIMSHWLSSATTLASGIFRAKLVLQSERDSAIYPGGFSITT